jgi:hypothetical protein
VDRDTFLFTVRNGDKYSLWTYSLKNRMAKRFSARESMRAPDGAFSHDGRWVAYSIAEARPTGGALTRRIVLQPFPIQARCMKLPVDGSSHSPRLPIFPHISERDPFVLPRSTQTSRHPTQPIIQTQAHEKPLNSKYSAFWRLDA